MSLVDRLLKQNCSQTYHERTFALSMVESWYVSTKYRTFRLNTEVSRNENFKHELIIMQEEENHPGLCIKY